MTRRETPDIMAAVLAGDDSQQATSLRIAEIRRDGGTQPRAGLDESHVSDLAAALAAGDTLPPVDVMHDGQAYWLYDGYHRVEAASRAGRYTVMATIHQGDQVAAQWASYAANPAHGLKRTNADKKRAVLAALRHPNAATMSNRAIAAHVHVDEGMVRAYRETLEATAELPQSTTRTGADGRTINTANIGASRPARQVDDAAEDAWRLPGVSGRAAVSQAATAKPEEATSSGKWDTYTLSVDLIAAGWVVNRIPGGATMTNTRTGQYFGFSTDPEESERNMRMATVPAGRPLMEVMRTDAEIAAEAEAADIAEREAAADEAERQAEPPPADRPMAIMRTDGGRLVEVWSTKAQVAPAAAPAPVEEQPQYASVAQLEEIVREAAARWYKDETPAHAVADLRSAARVSGGELWNRRAKTIGAYRPNDLAQAINNVASQMEERQARYAADEAARQELTQAEPPPPPAPVSRRAELAAMLTAVADAAPEINALTGVETVVLLASIRPLVAALADDGSPAPTLPAELAAAGWRLCTMRGKHYATVTVQSEHEPIRTMLRLDLAATIRDAEYMHRNLKIGVPA